jgi:hypothetical protein
VEAALRCERNGSRLGERHRQAGKDAVVGVERDLFDTANPGGAPLGGRPGTVGSVTAAKKGARGGTMFPPR